MVGGRVDSVIVQSVAVAGAGRGQAVHLGPGQVATFGRGSSDRRVDLWIGHPEVPRLAGRITAAADHWLLSNLSRDRTYVVENPEGAGEHVKVAPRRLEAPMPFEFARVRLPVAAGRAEFLVFAPHHVYAVEDEAPAADGEATATGLSLDPTAKYFLVLVALCEPRLRDASSAVVPTTREVADRLRPLPACAALTERAVGFHIDYLARTKLRLREGRRSELVSFALRFDLVRGEHLALLPPAARRRPAPARTSP
jgi:hypothetical protein